MKKSISSFAAAVIIFFCFAASLASGQTFSVGAPKQQEQTNTSDENFIQTQADRLKSPKPIDVLIFPSYVDFADVSAEWGAPCAEKQALKLAVNPVVISDAPEKTKVTMMFADVTGDDGETWRYLSLDENPETGEWSVKIEFPEWTVSTDTFATGTAAAPAGKNEAAAKPACTMKVTSLENSGAGEGPAVESPSVDVCFWAMDSLGNVTAQLYHQTKPRSEADVRFSPLVVDPADPSRAGPEPDYRNSPDRDILSTTGAWLRDQLLFRMKIAGTTIPYGTVPPGLNYYMIRFDPIDEPSFKIQLGAGMYHYHSVKRKHEEFLEDPSNESFPFQVEYDPLNLLQLAAIIEEAQQTPGFPRIFDEYRKLLKKEGLDDALAGKTPAPFRNTVFNTGITSGHISDRIYWAVNMNAFTGGASGGKPAEEKSKSEAEIEMEMETAVRSGAPANGGSGVNEEELPPGLIVRFYTGYKTSGESDSVVKDDTTTYSTILFGHHVFTWGEDVEGEKKTAPKARPWQLNPAGDEGQ